jgi:hypothetical protein
MINAKLTKKYFMNLPEKMLLISNICNNVAEPIFLEEIVPLEKREEQWQKIVATGAAQRQCHICNTMDEWTDFLFEVKNRQDILDAIHEKKRK